MQIDPLSTRIFPKGLGADKYKIAGLAGRCDWVVLSDWAPPQVALEIRNRPDSPRTVFLSTRAIFPAIRYFAEEVLPRISTPFILISGSADTSVPAQTDRRWRSFDEAERGMIREIATHPLLIRWFAENLDSAIYEKMRPLPLGMVFPDSHHDLIDVPNITDVGCRKKQVLCAHRVRDGEQWENRRRVTKLAETDWAGFCDVLQQEVSQKEFWEIASQYNFVLCVEGGGLDPSPKAWESILHGAIPIVRSSPLRPAYQELPVAFVDEWDPSAISLSKLEAWRKEMQNVWAQGPSEVFRRLSLDYWWEKIEREYGDHQL